MTTCPVQFILENRKGKVFRDWTQDQIAMCLNEAIEAKALALSFSVEDGIDGICTGKPDHERRILRVTHLLVGGREALRHILAFYRQRFSGWTITAKRRGREVIYSDTAKLVRRLERAR